MTTESAPLDAVPHPAALGQDHRRAGHRRVDVQPEPVPRRDLGDRARPDRAPSSPSCRSSRRPRTGRRPAARSSAIAACERVGAHRVTRRRAGRSADVARGRSRPGAPPSRPSCGCAPTRRRRAAAARPAARRGRARTRWRARARRAARRACSSRPCPESRRSTRSERPTIWRSQSVATSSSSVSAGLDCHASPSTPRPVLRKSPSTLDERRRCTGSSRRTCGCCQCVSPGMTTRRGRAGPRRTAPAAAGGDAGQLAPHLARRRSAPSPAARPRARGSRRSNRSAAWPASAELVRGHSGIIRSWGLEVCGLGSCLR